MALGQSTEIIVYLLRVLVVGVQVQGKTSILNADLQDRHIHFHLENAMQCTHFTPKSILAVISNARNE